MTTDLLTQLSNDFFQNSLDSSPTSAIMRGHKAYFEKLEELTDETFNKEAKVVDEFISRLGKDNYADLAVSLYNEAGVNFDGVQFDSSNPTGAAGIMVNEKTGENAINVVPGAAGTIDQKMVDDCLTIIKNSKIFLTQLVFFLTDRFQEFAFLY